MVPRGELGTRNGKEETLTGTETGEGTRGGKSTGMSSRVRMEARTGVGTETRIYMRVVERESLGTFEVVIEVGRKT